MNDLKHSPCRTVSLAWAFAQATTGTWLTAASHAVIGVLLLVFALLMVVLLLMYEQHHEDQQRQREHELAKLAVERGRSIRTSRFEIGAPDDPHDDAPSR